MSHQTNALAAFPCLCALRPGKDILAVEEEHANELADLLVNIPSKT